MVKTQLCNRLICKSNGITHVSLKHIGLALALEHNVGTCVLHLCRFQVSSPPLPPVFNATVRKVRTRVPQISSLPQKPHKSTEKGNKDNQLSHRSPFKCLRITEISQTPPKANTFFSTPLPSKTPLDHGDDELLQLDLLLPHLLASRSDTFHCRKSPDLLLDSILFVHETCFVPI